MQADAPKAVLNVPLPHGRHVASAADLAAGAANVPMPHSDPRQLVEAFAAEYLPGSHAEHVA
jgi:hypothetical protein